MILTHTSFQVGNQDPNPPLYQLGWSSFFQEQLETKDFVLSPARVVGVRKNCFLVNQGNGQLLVTMAGSLIYNDAAYYPAVGDWVLLRDSIIFSILSRQNSLIRKESGGKTRKNSGVSIKDQVIAVNLNKVFIVCGLDRDFNLRRIERYLTMVYNCGITPEIILTKADLPQNPVFYVDEVESVAFGVPVHLVSAEDEKVITHLKCNLTHGETVALIGSSGAGKSTLINRLYGEEIRATDSVSKRVGKGKHTTTNRDLIILPSGGMLIDNPGIREIAPGVGSVDVESAFPEIDELAHLCKFLDCSHTREPGCQVVKAVSDGLIAPERLKSFRKIQNELKYTSEREQKSSARVERERWKGLSQRIKEMKKTKKQ